MLTKQKLIYTAIRSESGSSKPHSGTKPGQDAGFEIDPNTFNLRRSRPAPTLYPQLSRLERERGEGGGGERDPLPSVPLLQAQLSPSHTKPFSNFLNNFQLSAPNARPNLIPHTTLPSFFQPSSSAPAFPPRSQFRPFTTAPPSIFTTAHSTHTNQLYQHHTPRPQYTNTSHTIGTYPPPTYPLSTQNNAHYTTGQGTSPWRGGGVATGLGGLIQPTQQPHNFLYQSGHTPSPTHFERTHPQQWVSDKLSLGLPGRVPARRREPVQLNHQWRLLNHLTVSII